MHKPDLYIQGVLNQDPGTAKNPVTLFNRGNRIDANADVVLPAAIDERLTFWVRELLKLPRAHAMVHSKIVVIDPFGNHPVVMTGSHNMGPKASGVNDENLLIVEGDSAITSQYACKIMEIYNQYRWRASQHQSSEGPRWKGLADDDTRGKSERRAPTHTRKAMTNVADVNSISGLASLNAAEAGVALGGARTAGDLRSV